MAQEQDNRQHPASGTMPDAANSPFLRDADRDETIPAANFNPFDAYALLTAAANTDPTRILFGAKLLGNRALSAGLSEVNGNSEQARALEERRRLREEERREEARLAEWNGSKQMFGGRMMSNADILQAMHDYNKDIDAHTEEAVKQGKIKREEIDEYKRTALRLEELKKLEQQGKLTEEQKREQKQLEESKLGQVYAGTAAEKARNDEYNKNAVIAASERTGTSYSKEVVSTITAPKLREDFKPAASFQSLNDAESLPKLERQPDIAQVQKNKLIIPGCA